MMWPAMCVLRTRTVITGCICVTIVFIVIQQNASVLTQTAAGDRRLMNDDRRNIQPGQVFKGDNQADNSMHHDIVTRISNIRNLGSDISNISNELTKTKRIDIQKNTSKIVLFAYYRGGSTFVADSFNQNDEAFYWFEPLMGSLEHMKKVDGIRTVDDVFVANGRNNLMEEHLPQKYTTAYARVITNILNCELHKVDEEVLRHKFATKWAMSRSMKNYRQCMGKDAGIHMRHCVDEMERVCQSSTIRVVKVVRMALYQIPAVLTIDPDIKVLYYTRDPRGMLVSRATISSKTPNQNVCINTGKRLCQRMSEDVNILDDTLNRYATSITTFKYEDLAFKPRESVQLIYDYMGLVCPDNILSWIQQNTHSSKDVGWTTKTNSTAVAIKWKTLLTDNTLTTLAEMCHTVLMKLGYPL